VEGDDGAPLEKEEIQIIEDRLDKIKPHLTEKGLQKIEEVDVTYEIDNQTYEGTMISRGSGWKFNLGLTLPLYSQ
jgi:hypothetical protein